MSPRLIGLAGYAGAGKDAVAAHLVADGWRRVSYADQLRRFLHAVDPLVEHHELGHAPVRLVELVGILGWEEAKRRFPDVRALMQRTGTDAGRTLLGENVWVDAALRGVRADERVAATDCRFPNECDAIRARGGLVVRVTRPGVGPVNDHTSETALDGYQFDEVIHNDGTLDDLAAAARALTR